MLESTGGGKRGLGWHHGTWALSGLLVAVPECDPGWRHSTRALSRLLVAAPKCGPGWHHGTWALSGLLVAVPGACVTYRP